MRILGIDPGLAIVGWSVVDIFENGKKVETVTTGSDGEAIYKTTKSETFTAEYCSNYDSAF